MKKGSAKTPKTPRLARTDFGAWRLDPLPSEASLRRFYADRYYAELERAGRTREARLISGGAARRSEIAWLRETAFADRLAVLGQHLPRGRRSLLEIGCGSGEFLSFMRRRGWKVTGIEPSTAAAACASRLGTKVFFGTLNDFVASPDGRHSRFDVIVLSHVLEHLPDPIGLLRTIRHLLRPGGMMILMAPNERNPLQRAAEHLVRRKRWWVAVPDHLYYWSHSALATFVSRHGFRIMHKTTDFPMELFILFGENYVDEPKRGSACHAKRQRFERALSPVERRVFYESLARIGWGRNTILYAKKI